MNTFAGKFVSVQPFPCPFPCKSRPALPMFSRQTRFRSVAHVTDTRLESTSPSADVLTRSVRRTSAAGHKLQGKTELTLKNEENPNVYWTIHGNLGIMYRVGQIGRNIPHPVRLWRNFEIPERPFENETPQKAKQNRISDADARNAAGADHGGFCRYGVCSGRMA